MRSGFFWTAPDHHPIAAFYPRMKIIASHDSDQYQHNAALESPRRAA
jgi:hypothetical protein